MKIFRELFKYARFWGGKYRCIVCKRPLRRFFPFSEDLQRKARNNGFEYDFHQMETLNVTNCNCPFCLSSDRERLYFIYLEHYFSQTKKGKYSILDFAPSDEFAKQLKAKSNTEYYSADLMRPNVDLHLDICNMKELNDDRYDIIICSHVLEHVPDPDAALRELFRILRHGGIAIIMVPIFLGVKETIDDPSHTSDEQRLKFYGQMDHVRLFSRQDFLSRVRHAGFTISEVVPSMLDKVVIQKNAIAENSILYVCSRS